MIKLYYAPGTCALAPHIVLKWLNVPHETIRVKLGDPDYLKINPLGVVPAMTDNEGQVMAQNDALLKYLANKHPDAHLGSSGGLENDYELDYWLAFLTGDLHPAYFPFFNPHRYTINKDEASLAASKQAGTLLVTKMLNHLEEHMADKNHLVDGRRTIADPYAFAMLRWSKPLNDHPNLQRFYQSLLTDEGVKLAMQEQGID